MCVRIPGFIFYLGFGLISLFGGFKDVFGEDSDICRNTLLRLAGSSPEADKQLARRAPSGEMIIRQGEGIAGRLIPYFPVPIVESKPIKNSEIARVEALVRDLFDDGILFDDGHIIEQVSRAEREENDVIARFVRTRPRPVVRTDAIEKRTEPLISELPWNYKRETDEVVVVPVYKEGHIDGGFRDTQNLKFIIQFTESNGLIKATLIVMTPNGKRYPWVVYEIPNEQLRASAAEPFSAANIRYQVNTDSNSALQNLTPAPTGFWFHLKTQTISILKQSAQHWLNHRINKAS